MKGTAPVGGQTEYKVVTVTGIKVLDIRFPTSRTLDGSDAMNLDPDYSADFYMAQIVGGTTQFLGSIVYREFSPNLPFAAAYSTLPIIIMLGYLFVARSSGALEEL